MNFRLILNVKYIYQTLLDKCIEFQSFNKMLSNPAINFWMILLFWCNSKFILDGYIFRLRLQKHFIPDNEPSLACDRQNLLQFGCGHAIHCNEPLKRVIDYRTSRRKYLNCLWNTNMTAFHHRTKTLNDSFSLPSLGRGNPSFGTNTVIAFVSIKNHTATQKLPDLYRLHKRSLEVYWKVKPEQWRNSYTSRLSNYSEFACESYYSSPRPIQ